MIFLVVLSSSILRSFQSHLLLVLCVLYFPVVARLNPHSNPYNTIGPGLVYQPALRGEIPFTEGYDYKTGFGHAGSMTAGCREQANAYMKSCQGMDKTNFKSKCDVKLAKWQVDCLYGAYLH